MASPVQYLFACLLFSGLTIIKGSRLLIEDSFKFEEATIADIQAAFKVGQLTSYQLVQHYLDQIIAHNPRLHAVIEVNPDALANAASADEQRKVSSPLSPLHGVPVLVKDSIATRDRLNTTSGSFALLGSIVPRDAGIITRLHSAGAIILGKASMTEWDVIRSVAVPQGWSPRGGQGRNPYPAAPSPAGTSSGSAIAVAANLVTVSLGTDLDGAISCPASVNSVVGIKPTVGLTSRSGIVPISPRLDTVGPMARTVADAVALLDEIVGIDSFDEEATRAAAPFIPSGGFKQLLKVDGLKGKRVGILSQFFDPTAASMEAKGFAAHLTTMRLLGATLIDNLEIKNIKTMENITESGEVTSILAEFKLSLNRYLKELVSSPVRSLSDIIAFNNQHPYEEKMEYGQEGFLLSEQTNGIGEVEKKAIQRMAELSKEGVETLIKDNNLDAVVYPYCSASHVLAIGGYPIITVPAGYGSKGSPLGISFSGLWGSDAKLIEIAYAFEQSTKLRKPPPHA